MKKKGGPLHPGVLRSSWVEATPVLAGGGSSEGLYTATNRRGAF